MNSTRDTRRRASGAGPAPRSPRNGKVLVLCAVLLPMLVAFLGLVIDGSLLMLGSRAAQHAADAAATAAAAELAWGDQDPEQTARDYVFEHNGLSAAQISVNIPPSGGAFDGRTGYVEVILRDPYDPPFVRVAAVNDGFAAAARAVAGLEASTAPAAVVVLDPDPPPINLAPLPIALPSLNSLVGGLEVLGVGRLRVNGAIHVNNEWGGVDDDGRPVGNLLSLSNAVSCTPVLPLTRVEAPDIRVVGGVDDPRNYAPLQPGQPHPLKANQRPVPDPYANLPVPTVLADPLNVVPDLHGGVTVVGLPLLAPPTRLRPGVYDWIEIVSGNVVFDPGVYIIRGRSPLSQIGLSLIAGRIRAEGVLFYLTDSPAYTPASGMPDAADGETPPSGPGLLTLVPSALINAGLLNSRFSGLDSPGSPFHGMLLYQRRLDRRPIVLVNQQFLGGGQMSGNVYAKWAHTILTGQGTYRSAFAVGSLRTLDVIDARIEPLQHLPPAYDVYLVE